MRWSVFALVVLVQLGASINGQYVAAVAAVVFCVFLTVHQSKVVAYTKLPYVVVFALMALLYLAGLYVDLPKA